jgi:hypothetical protein
MKKNIFELIREVSEARNTPQKQRLITQDLINGINAELKIDFLKIRAVKDYINSTEQRLSIEDFTKIISEISVNDDDLRKDAIIEFANKELQYLKSLRNPVDPRISRITFEKFGILLEQANLKNADVKMSIIIHFINNNLIDNITAEEFQDLITRNRISENLVTQNSPLLIRSIYESKNYIKVFRLLIEKYIKNPVNFFYHENIFLGAICSDINLLRELIDVCPQILQINTRADETLSSLALSSPDCLQLIMEKKSDFFSQIVRKNFPSLIEMNIVFYAVNLQASDALKAMIGFKPDIVEGRDIYGNTIIFEALRSIELKSFKAIIEAKPEVLFQINSSGDTPVFYALKHHQDLKFFEEILRLVDRDTIKKILQQENKTGEIPICKMIEFYSLNPTDNNLKILKSAYEIQFGKQLEDDEIKNLADFIKNLNYLKVISKNAYSLKKQYIENIFGSFLSRDLLGLGRVQESDVLLKIVEIYQDILEDKKLAFSFPNQDGKESKFYIHDAGFNNHQSCFIFHVNEQNKLTAISYCDDYLFHNYKKTENSDYINGITTYQSLKDIDFNDDFVKKFLQEQSSNKNIRHFKGVRSRYFEFGQDAISHSIPILKDPLIDPSPIRIKSTLAQFLARQCCSEEISDLDPQYLTPRGEVFEAHKELLDGVTYQSTGSFIEGAKKIDPVFWRSAHVQGAIDHFLKDRPMVSKEEHQYQLEDLFKKKQSELVELDEMESRRSFQHFSSLGERQERSSLLERQEERSSLLERQERPPSPELASQRRASTFSCFSGLQKVLRVFPR